MKYKYLVPKPFVIKNYFNLILKEFESIQIFLNKDRSKTTNQNQYILNRKIDNSRNCENEKNDIIKFKESNCFLKDLFKDIVNDNSFDKDSKDYFQSIYVKNLLCHFTAQKTYLNFHEKYFYHSQMDQSEKVRLTAKRVGLLLPKKLSLH